jgi:hypothetical protein
MLLYEAHTEIVFHAATGLWAGRPGFDSQQQQNILLFLPRLRPIQLPLSKGIKRHERETNHSPPSIAVVKKGGTMSQLLDS